jgi:hypothetical protein
VLRYTPTLGLTLALAASAACKSKREAPPPPPPPVAAIDAGAPDADQAGAHGDKWKGGEPGDEFTDGGFQNFKEAWVYVDGKPAGVLREPELPPMPVAWTKKDEDVEFDANSTGPRVLYYLAKRWRVTDYLTAIGVDLAKVKLVCIHGGRGVVYLPGDVLRKWSDGLRFDLTGVNRTKLRVFLPTGMPRNVSFDRYVAITVYVDKPLPELEKSTDYLLLDGQPVGDGIPYYGSPIRGGIRIYKDGQLAFALKRNLLGEVGRVAGTTDRWNLADLLAANGVTTDDVVAADLISRDWRGRYHDFDMKRFEFTVAEQAQGKIIVAATRQPIEAIQLFSKDRVPPVWSPAPDQTFLDGKTKEPYPATEPPDPVPVAAAPAPAPAPVK